MTTHKKGHSNLKKQPPGIFRPPVPSSNENRLKQIYEAKNLITPSKKSNYLSSNPNNPNILSSQREGQKIINQTQKQNRYHLPLPIARRQRIDRSQGQVQISHGKTNRYRSYLQSTVANITQGDKQKHSHRYHNQPPITERANQRQYQRKQHLQIKQRPKLSSVYNLNQTQSIRQIQISQRTRVHRSTNNQSADMFKIRQKKTPYQKKRVNPVINSSNIKASQGHIDLDYLQEAKMQYRKGNIEQALKLFEAGISHGTKHPQMHYYAALIYLNQHRYEQGYQHLKKLLKEYPSFKKSAYLFIAIACKNIGTIQQKKLLQKQLKPNNSQQQQANPSPLDNNLINNKKNTRKQVNKSKLSKYSQINEVQKEEQQEDQECNVSEQKLEQGIYYCTLGIKRYQDYVDLIAYRGKLYQYLGKFQQAHLDFQKVLQMQSNHIQALYRDARCLRQLGLINNCLAKFNKALSLDQNGPFAFKILIEKAQINLANNNIKDAKRDVEILFGLSPQSSRVHVLQGIIYTNEGNKKKAVLSFQQALNYANSKKAMNQALIQITKHKIEDRDFYSALHHINRSQFLELSNSNIELYRIFTEGVIFLMKRKIAQGVNNFNQIIQNYSKQLQKCEYIKRIFYLYRAFGNFMLNKHDKAIQDYQFSQKLIQKNKNAFYNELLAKGIVEVQKKNYTKSFQFFDKAQNLVQEKIQPFIYRAVANVQRAKQQLGNDLQQLRRLELIFAGLKQLDLANQVNDGNSNLLYIRCLIYLYLGKTEQGLQDIVKAISKSQQNIPKYFFYRALAHNTLRNKKQALNDFNICINLDDNFKLAFFERAKIHFHNLSINKGIEDLNKFSMLQQRQLQGCSSQVKCQAGKKDISVGGYNQSDIKCHEFLLYFSLKMFQQAEQVLEDIKDEQKKKLLKIELYLKQGKPLKAKQLMEGAADRSICDIIGNVDLQKDALQKAIKAQRQTIDNYKNRQTINTITEAKSLGLKHFTIVHYYHYLGVLSFRIGQYDQAINNFTLALKQKSLQDLEEGISHSNIMNNNMDQEEQQSSRLFDSTPQEPVQNSIHYNLFLCNLQKGDIKKAYEIFIRDILPAKQSLLKNQQMGQFSHLLFQTMKNAQNQKKSQEVQANGRNNSKVGRIVKQNNESLPIFTLPLMMTAYSNLTDSVTINLTSFALITKLSLPVPHPTNLLRPYCLKLNPQFILESIKMSQVQNRPQPPWIKRTADGLMFTDDVRQINVEFQTTINDEEQEEQDQSEQDESEQQESEEQAQEQQSIDFRKLKDKMKLDDSIERKLKKIMQKKEK